MSLTASNSVIAVPAMFGRELFEQVQADSQGDDRQVPIIVEKCIQAVEAVGMTILHSFWVIYF